MLIQFSGVWRGTQDSTFQMSCHVILIVLVQQPPGRGILVGLLRWEEIDKENAK